MTTGFRVRHAQPADAPSLAQLRWLLKQEDEGLQEPPDVATFLHRAESWIGDRLIGARWLAWVAEAENVICGQVFLQLVERMPDPWGDSAPIGYVTNFYVTPDQRNRGIGAALLRALTEHAQAADGCDTLIVWPSDRSAPLFRCSWTALQTLERP